MVKISARRTWLFVFGLLLLGPIPSLASETDRQDPSLPESTPVTPTGQVTIPEGEEGGVTSRGAGDFKMQRPPLSPEVINKLSQLPMPGPAPANLTVTVVTPTNLRVEWFPSPGAVRYLISRNGAPDITIEANAGFLQGSRFLYLDAGRKPATLHTYSVTAQFNPPLLPERSTAVQILTPPALPPSNFRASVSGPNAVTLTWTGRPEASSYRIIRNGGSLPATVLNATGGLSHVDQNLPPGEYSYLIYSVIRLASGEELHGEFSNPVTVQARPFNIIAIGDSVMWGQGLSEQNKFTRKVAAWLESSLGKRVNLSNLARSGAITHFAHPNGDPEPPCPPDNKMCPDSSEVPWSFPSIVYQAKTMAPALVTPSDVDLVLVDGCANNVDMTNIIDPGGNDEELRTITRAYCNTGMQSVLTEVARTFPRAKVAVTGYFPIISLQSNLGVVVPMWVTIGLVSTAAAHAGVPIPFIPPDPIAGGVVAAILQARAAARSDIFYLESTSGLQSAVSLLNATTLGGNRFRFAPLSVGSDNSYGALHSWLWLIPAPPGVKDEVYDARWKSCDRWPDASFADTKCRQASLAHPNVAGAQGYTDALTTVLNQFVPEWRTLHAASVTAPDDSLVIKVQPGTSDTSGGTMVVTATNGPSGPALPGTIQVNGLPAGPLGAQIRYAYQQNSPTDILARVDVSGYRSRSFTIPVRTQSIAVNLTNNGDPRTAIVTATDAVTGQPLSGTVTLNPASPKQVVGATGQPVTYPSCGQITSAQQFTAFTLSAGPAPCGGTVRVSFYPEAVFQDTPGTSNVGTIQLKNDNLPQRATPFMR